MQNNMTPQQHADTLKALGWDDCSHFLVFALPTEQAIAMRVDTDAQAKRIASAFPQRPMLYRGFKMPQSITYP